MAGGTEREEGFRTLEFRALHDACVKTHVGNVGGWTPGVSEKCFQVLRIKLRSVNFGIISPQRSRLGPMSKRKINEQGNKEKQNKKSHETQNVDFLNAGITVVFQY